MPPQYEERLHAASEALRALGFGSYEARTYCALLADSPANGYQLAQRSGVPRAKVYGSLRRLVEKGAAVEVESGGRQGRRFVPTDPDELISRRENELQSALGHARSSLKDYRRSPGQMEVLWRVTSQADLVERGVMLATEARQTLHAAIWAREFDALQPEVTTAIRRGVRIALVLYDPHPKFERFQRRCPGAILHGSTKREAIAVMGRQFVLVADRRRCITGSIFPDERVEGVFTLNRGLVTNAVDLVNHEIYLERIMAAAADPVKAVFGPDLEHLDPFWPPDPPGA